MKVLCFCCAVFLTASLAVANGAMDIRAPTPTIKQGKVALHSSLEIVPDPKALEARLQITQSTLNELRAENAGVVQQGFVSAVGFSSKRTMVAGLLMFLALSVAGVLLARKFSGTQLSRTQKGALALVLFAGVIAAGTMVTRANAGPPGAYRWRNLSESLNQGRSMAGGIQIEVVPDSEMAGDRLRLIMPVKPRNPGEE